MNINYILYEIFQKKSVYRRMINMTEARECAIISCKIALIEEDKYKYK